MLPWPSDLGTWSGRPRSSCTTRATWERHIHQGVHTLYQDALLVAERDIPLGLQMVKKEGLACKVVHKGMHVEDKQAFTESVAQFFQGPSVGPLWPVRSRSHWHEEDGGVEVSDSSASSAPPLFSPPRGPSRGPKEGTVQLAEAPRSRFSSSSESMASKACLHGAA